MWILPGTWTTICTENIGAPVCAARFRTPLLSVHTSIRIQDSLERGVSFKEALNDAIRSGAGSGPASKPFRTETAALGESRVNLDRALQIAADLEDDELVRKLRTGS